MRKLILGITAIVCLDAVFIALTYLAGDIDLSVKAIATNAEKHLELYWMNDLVMDSFIPTVAEERTLRPEYEFRGPVVLIKKVDRPKVLRTSHSANLFPARVIYIPAPDRDAPPEPSRIRIVKSGNNTVIFYPGPQRTNYRQDRSPAKKVNYVARLIPFRKKVVTP